MPFKTAEIKTAHIVVTLLNENHQPLRTWNVYNAWPKKWSVSDLNAGENSLVVETLDFSYSFFTVLPGPDSNSSNHFKKYCLCHSR